MSTTETQTADKLMVTITSAAANAARKMLEQHDNPKLRLRLGVRGGGCSGLQYAIDLDDDIDLPFDRVYESAGIPVVIDRKSAVYLAGAELDFDTDIFSGGFKINNPNAKRDCGCGTSFMV